MAHFLEKDLVTGSGCDSVGRAVPSDTRGPWIESSHRQIMHIGMRTIQKKRLGMGMSHFLKKRLGYRLCKPHSHVLQTTLLVFWDLCCKTPSKKASLYMTLWWLLLGPWSFFLTASRTGTNSQVIRIVDLSIEEPLFVKSSPCADKVALNLHSLHQYDQIGRFLQVLSNKLSHSSSPNILVTFWAISNNVIFGKSVGILLGNFGGKLGNF